MSSIAGEIVTEAFDYEGGRQVTVYVPAPGGHLKRSCMRVTAS